MTLSRATLLVSCLFLSACAARPEQLRRAMLEHPEIVIDVLARYPERLAAFAGPHLTPDRDTPHERPLHFTKAQLREMDARAEAEQKVRAKMEARMAEHREVDIAGRAMKNPAGKVLIVAYLDLTGKHGQFDILLLERVMRKYSGKVKLVIKHFPEGEGALSMAAALRFEALAVGSPVKAYAFAEALASDPKLSEDESGLDAAVKRAGEDPEKIRTVTTLPKLKQLIASDGAEAASIGFRKSPGYVAGGVTLPAAVRYDFEYSIRGRLRELGDASGRSIAGK